jgi:tetratricopeptide (TPR) repeat protein
MNVQAILDRILDTVDREAYLTPTAQVDARYQPALALIGRGLADPETDAATLRELAHALHRDGRLDKVHYHSALHVIAAHPSVADYAEAARQAAEQEQAAYSAGGANLQANLASVDRHRGVLAFLQGQYGAALDYFTRAMERQRTPENLGNVLCTLIRLGEEDEARGLVDAVRRALPDDFLGELDARISQDPDLAPLRPEAS